MKLQVVNFQKMQMCIPAMWGMSDLVACPPSPVCWPSFGSTISHFLSLLQSVTLLACWLDASPCMPAVVLCYCTVRLKNVFFILCLFCMYCLCEKYYNPITIQHYIADCVSWVPRLTLLDLGTNWNFEQALTKELICM